MKKAKAEPQSLSGKALAGAFFRDLRPISWGLVLGAVLAAGSVLLAAAAPRELGNAVDVLNDFFLNGGALDFGRLNGCLLLLLCIYVAAAVFESCKILLLNNVVSRHFTCALRIRMSDKIRRLPVSFVDRTKKGELISRMTGDVSVIGNTVHTFVDLLTLGLFQLAAISVMMFSISWQLALVVLVLVPVSLVCSVLLAHRSEKHFTALQKQMGEMYTVVEETYAGLKTVRGYGQEERMYARHAEVNERRRATAKKAYFQANIVQPLISFVNKAGYIAICLLGGYLAVTNVLSVGAVVAVVLYAKQFSAPLEGIAFGIAMFQRTRASAKRVYGVLAEPEMEERDNGEAIDGAGDVRFSNVCFSYDKDSPLIEGLSVTVEPGKKVAIVGPTGGGKTTIVNLLMRFYDVDSGTITVGGTDVAQVPRARLRDAFGMVLQDTWLFTGTVAENVAYGKPGASREEVEAACKSACCDRFIRALPNGYDTLINEDATNVSGGQKQLLTIARAFLADRKILILDEATSNVDTRTEALVQEAMNRLMRGRTCFVIAHRLSTIVHSDNILVVRDGAVVEQGRHEELLDRRGFYYDLFNSQYRLGGAEA